MRSHTPVRALVLTLLAGAALARPAAAQQSAPQAPLRPGIPTPCEEADDSPYGRRPELCRPRTFNLFGIGDNAVAGLRSAAPDMQWAVASSTPGDRTAMAGALPINMRGVQADRTALSSRFFEYHFYEAASQTDWKKAKAAVPSLENVRGGGWTFATNSSQYGGPDLFTGKDGTFGILFAGVQSGDAATGNCTDQSASGLPKGLTLLAISDCQLTWPGGVWKGSPYLSQQSFVDFRGSVGASNFSFDFWRVPTRFADADRRFIGTVAQTYAVSSDHGRQTRARYGNVVKGGTGDPQLEGYPIGLDWYWDAMTFDVGAVARMQLIQATIVNNSAEIYDKGIDYDSLFVGLQTRWLHAPPGSGRRANVHSIPSLGAVVANELGRTANCDGATFPSGTFGAGCSALTSRIGRGFGAGATGVVILKSPIGDLRNKMFTKNPSNPFYDPAHPNRGDTITFNRMSVCGFDCANVQVIPHDVRKAYGLVTANIADALDGRSPTSIGEYDWWGLVKPLSGSFQNLRGALDLSRPRAGGGFNYCVPGNWRYSNRPAGAAAPGTDTLFYDDCNPVTNGITALWSDTLPNREINWAFNDSWEGAGPFPLKAGETTSFVFAIITAPDSVQFMQLLNNSVDFYSEFYLGPGAPLAPRIQYAVADSGVAGLSETRVRLYLDYARTNSADPSVALTVRKLTQALPGTPERRLIDLNPWLADSITRRALTAVDTIFVFKSCNRGETFTASLTQTSGACLADRALDAAKRPIGTGWQAYATLTRDRTTGLFPDTYTDASVVGGQRYLYSLVAHRPAITFTVSDSGTIGSDTTKRLISRTYTALPEASSTLSTNTNSPQVRDVYVPVSSQSGSVGTRVAGTTVGPTPLSYHVAAVTAASAPTGPLDYTVFFGDSIRLIQRDHRARGTADSTIILLFRSARTGFTATGASRNAPRDTLTFVVPALTELQGATTAFNDATTLTAIPASGSLPADTVAERSRTYRTFTAVVAESAPISAGRYRGFFASAAMTQGSTTPFQPSTALAQNGAPPLLFNVRNRGGVFAESFWTEPGFFRLRAQGLPSISVLQDSTHATGVAYGDYAIGFRATEYGPGAPFVIDPSDPSRTEEAVTASLTAREVADTTAIDAATVAAINTSLGRSLTTDSLARLSLPFRIRNLASDTTAGTPVIVAVLKSQLRSRLVLGSGVDTISVAAPPGIWIPGTPLILLEDVTVADSTAGGRAVESGDALATHTVRRVTYDRFTIGCTALRSSCNPVSGLGANGHIRVRPQQTLRVRYFNPYTSESELRFAITPPVVGSVLASQQGANPDGVLVVPNPYIVQSSYELGVGEQEKRLLFTHVPAQGVIRIYTASGSFVQELRWSPDQLNGTGDLFWDMRTRENTLIGPGLYLYTVEATGPSGRKGKRPGRFIIIR